MHELGGDGARLQGVELRQLDLQLRRLVGTAASTHDRRPLLVARVVTDRGEGWGECGALVDGTSVDPPLDTVRRWAVDVAVPRLLAASVARGGALPEPSTAASIAGSSPADRLVAGMLEMALLDVALTVDGESLAAHLGAEATSVLVGAMVGIPDRHDVGALLAAVDLALDPATGGAARVRLKIAPGWDRVPVEAVRERHPDLLLQADANGSYHPGEDGEGAGARLAALDPFDLACVEQPFAASDLVSHSELAGRIRTPVGLDESLRSLRHVRDALRYGAMGVACLKPGRLGGLLVAREAHDRCVAAGVAAFVGGFFESGLGRSANLALAGLPGFSLPGDLTAPNCYLDDAPFGYPSPDRARIAVPDGPGTGSAPHPEVVERCTVWREWISPGAT